MAVNITRTDLSASDLRRKAARVKGAHATITPPPPPKRRGRPLKNGGAHHLHG